MSDDVSVLEAVEHVAAGLPHVARLDLGLVLGDARPDPAERVVDPLEAVLHLVVFFAFGVGHGLWSVCASVGFGAERSRKTAIWLAPPKSECRPAMSLQVTV